MASWFVVQWTTICIITTVGCALSLLLLMSSEILSVRDASADFGTDKSAQLMMSMLPSDRSLELQKECVQKSMSTPWYQWVSLMLSGTTKQNVTLYPLNYHECSKLRPLLKHVVELNRDGLIFPTTLRTMAVWPVIGSTQLLPKCCLSVYLTESTWTWQKWLLSISSLLMLVVITWHMLMAKLYHYSLGAGISTFFVTQTLDILIRLSGQRYGELADIRQQFANTPVVRSHVKTNNGHPHPRSARDRNDANNTMRVFADYVGKRLFMVQESASDQKRGGDGIRTYHWARDLSLEANLSFVTDDHIIGMVDVDYYYDMPTLLSRCANIYMIATLQPTAVAHHGSEYSFRFNTREQVEYMVSGGAKYVHHVWDYSTDFLVAVSSSWCGLIKHVAGYTVSRLRFDEHHCIILLVPSIQFISPLWDPTHALGGRRLATLAPVAGDFATMDVQLDNGLTRSIAKVGTWCSANVPVGDAEALAATSRLNSSAITVAQVKTVLKSDDQTTCSILAEYFRQNKSTVTTPVVFAPPPAILHYQYGLEQYDPEAKTSLHSFMDPIIADVYAPMKTRGNDLAAVEGRVKSVAQEDKDITATLLGYLDEFVALLVPEELVHKAHPVDLDYVYDKQARPTQRSLLDKIENLACDVSDDRVVTFQKAEAYSGPKEPRIITTIPTTNKLHYSSFTYAFAQHMRQQKWYAFGKNPKEISERVAEICHHSVSHVTKTDLHRMDGHINNVCRLTEQMAMLRFFAVTYHKQLRDLMATQKQRRAVTGFGVKYDTGNARLSGSPETADFNSLDNGLGSYMGLRRMGLSIEEAWKKLGLFGGDDGLQGDIDPKLQTLAYADLGQVLEAEVVKRGDLGVEFLSRIYGPDVWFGEPNNMCDIKRQLTKFHTTVHLPSSISPMNKFATKLYSYYLTDRNTPIIGDLATAAVNLCCDYIIHPDGNDVARRALISYYANHPAQEQFINFRQDWMLDIVHRDLPNFDLVTFQRWLGHCKADIQLFLHPPLCQPPLPIEPAKVPIVVNDDVVKPIKSDKPQTKTPSPAGKKYVPVKGSDKCRHFLVGKCTMGEKCRFKH